jgi:hypothetical protein
MARGMAMAKSPPRRAYAGLVFTDWHKWDAQSGRRQRSNNATRAIAAGVEAEIDRLSLSDERRRNDHRLTRLPSVKRRRREYNRWQPDIRLSNGVVSGWQSTPRGGPFHH